MPWRWRWRWLIFSAMKITTRPQPSDDYPWLVLLLLLLLLGRSAHLWLLHGISGAHGHVYAGRIRRWPRRLELSWLGRRRYVRAPRPPDIHPIRRSTLAELHSQCVTLNCLALTSQKKTATELGYPHTRLRFTVEVAVMLLIRASRRARVRFSANTHRMRGQSSSYSLAARVRRRLNDHKLTTTEETLSFVSSVKEKKVKILQEVCSAHLDRQWHWLSLLTSPLSSLSIASRGTCTVSHHVTSQCCHLSAGRRLICISMKFAQHLCTPIFDN